MASDSCRQPSRLPRQPVDSLREARAIRTNLFVCKHLRSAGESARESRHPGRAAFSTRIKLADAQTVTAIAEMSDGTLWMDSASVIVTLAACLEDIL